QDNILGTSRAWSDDQEIEQQLGNLIKQIRDVNQKLQNQYPSLVEYNRAAGENAEPFHVLVVMDFPTNFTPRALRNLLIIAHNGPRCGISTIVVTTTKLGTKRFQRVLSGFDVRELEKV